jgi:MYXO-CTERM domain-containing protein
VPEFCGDGVVNNDGAEDCEPPGTAACRDDCSVRTALCGDGFLTAPEQCDDGNVTVDDGCSADCKVEIPAFCGDGSLDEDEECDDGNLDDGDGCSQSCVLEDSDIPDGGMPMPDAGIPIPDGGVASPDAGVALPDGGVGDAGDSPEPGPGLRNGTVTGGCSVGGGTAPVDPAILLALLGLVLSRRRRAHRLIPERSGGGSEDHLRDRRYPSRGRRSRLA